MHASQTILRQDRDADRVEKLYHIHRVPPVPPGLTHLNLGLFKLNQSNTLWCLFVDSMLYKLIETSDVWEEQEYTYDPKVKHFVPRHTYDDEIRGHLYGLETVNGVVPVSRKLAESLVSFLLSKKLE